MASFEKILLNEFDGVFGPYQYKSSSLFDRYNPKTRRTSRLFSQSESSYIHSENISPQTLKSHEEPAFKGLECRTQYERPFVNSSLLLEAQPISTHLSFKPAVYQNNIESGQITQHSDESSFTNQNYTNPLLNFRLQSYKNHEAQNSRRDSIDYLLEERDSSPFKKQLTQSNKKGTGEAVGPLKNNEKSLDRKQVLPVKKTEQNQYLQTNLSEKRILNHQQPIQSEMRDLVQKSETNSSKFPHVQSANLKSVESMTVDSELNKSEKPIWKSPAIVIEEEKVETVVKPKEQNQDRKKAAKPEEKQKNKIPNFENIFERFSNGSIHERTSVSEKSNDEVEIKEEPKAQPKLSVELTKTVSNEVNHQPTSQEWPEVTLTTAGVISTQNTQTSVAQGQEETAKSPKKKKKPKKKKNQSDAAKEDTTELQSQDTNKTLSLTSGEEEVQELTFSDLERISDTRQTVVEEDEIEVTQNTKSRYNDKTYNFEELGKRFNILMEDPIICNDFIAQQYLQQGCEGLIPSLTSEGEAAEGGKKKKRRKRNKKKSKKAEADTEFIESDYQGADYMDQNPSFYPQHFNYYFSNLEVFICSNLS